MTAASVTDPNGDYPIKPGAFVGFDYSTTELQGGEMLVASPDGQNKIPKLSPDGQFLFNSNDGDNMWTLIKPKIQMPKLDWSAITNKPDVAAKSDLTWANISGKPSIPDVNATTTVSSGDLNNYTMTGKYYMPNELSNYTNHPTGTDMGGFVMKVDSYHNGDMIIQTIYQINSGDVWIRQHWVNSWKAWRQVTFWPKGG